jgi:hypothetical protein
MAEVQILQEQKSACRAAAPGILPLAALVHPCTSFAGTKRRFV